MKRVISAERLVVGDTITANVDSKGRRTELARPCKVRSIATLTGGGSSIVNTRAGSKTVTWTFERDEQIEIEVSR